MIELVKEVEVKINTGEKVESFKVKKRTPSKKERKEYENWSDKRAKEHTKLDKVTKEIGKLSKKVAKLEDRVDDINRLIDVIKDKERIVRLIDEKSELNTLIDKTEAKLDVKQREFEQFKDEVEKLTEDIWLKNYKMLVVEDEESKRLLEYAKEIGLSVSELLAEINRVAKEMAEKK